LFIRYLKYLLCFIVGLFIGIITGWLAFDNIGSGMGIGVAMGCSICGVVFALETENGS
jgi:hypothetical protein